MRPARPVFCYYPIILLLTGPPKSSPCSSSLRLRYIPSHYLVSAYPMNSLLPTPLVPVWYLAIPMAVVIAVLYRLNTGGKPLMVRSLGFSALVLASSFLVFPVLLLALRLVVPDNADNALGILLLASAVYMLNKLLVLVLPRITFRTGARFVLLLGAVDAVILLFWFVLPLPAPFIDEFAGDGIVLAVLWAAYLVGAHQLRRGSALQAPVAPVAASPAPEAVAEPSLGMLGAARDYMLRGEALNIMPTPHDFTNWLSNLPAADRQKWIVAGMQNSWALSFPFRRFVLEDNGLDYASFLAERLEPAEFTRWVDAAY